MIYGQGGHWGRNMPREEVKLAQLERPGFIHLLHLSFRRLCNNSNHSAPPYCSATSHSLVSESFNSNHLISCCAKNESLCQPIGGNQRKPMLLGNLSRIVVSKGYYYSLHKNLLPPTQSKKEMISTKQYSFLSSM